MWCRCGHVFFSVDGPLSSLGNSTCPRKLMLCPSTSALLARGNVLPSSASLKPSRLGHDAPPSTVLECEAGKAFSCGRKSVKKKNKKVNIFPVLAVHVCYSFTTGWMPSSWQTTQLSWKENRGKSAGAGAVEQQLLQILAAPCSWWWGANALFHRQPCPEAETTALQEPIHKEESSLFSTSQEQGKHDQHNQDPPSV